MSPEQRAAYLSGLEKAGSLLEDTLDAARLRYHQSVGASAAFAECASAIQGLLTQQAADASADPGAPADRWLSRASIAIDGLRRRAETQQVGFHAVVSAYEGQVAQIKKIADAARVEPQHPGIGVVAVRKEVADAGNP